MATGLRVATYPAVRRGPTVMVTVVLAALGGVAIGGLVFVNTLYAVLLTLGIGVLMLFVVQPEWAMMGVLFSRTLIGFLPQHGQLGLPGMPRWVNLELLIAVFLIAGGLIYLLVYGLPFFKAPLTLPFLIFLGAIFLTIPTSQIKLLSLTQWFRMVTYFIIYIFVYALVSRRPEHRDRWWKFTIFWAAAIPALAWVATVTQGDAWRVLRSQLVRLQGPFGALEFGTLLMIPTLLFVVRFIETRGVSRWWSGFWLTVTAVSFLLSLARAPWAGFLVAIVVIGILRYRKLPFLVAGVAIVAMLAAPSLYHRVAELFLTPEQTTLENRVTIWSEAVQSFREHPVLGMGFGVGLWYAAYETAGRAHMTHSDFVRVLADAGLVGITGFLLFLAAQGLHAWQVFRAVRIPLHLQIAIVFLGAWIAYMVARGTGNVLTHAEFNYQFWTLAGLASALPALEANLAETPTR